MLPTLANTVVAIRLLRSSLENFRVRPSPQATPYRTVVFSKKPSTMPVALLKLRLFPEMPENTSAGSSA